MKRIRCFAFSFAFVVAVSGMSLTIIGSITGNVTGNGTARASVDLHTHAFMDRGAPILFDGHFFGPIRATKWSDALKFQTNPETVLQSGIQILVVALYAHPLARWDMRESVREQIRDAERFVRENPEFVIAKTPADARRALSDDKRLIVFSLEGASGILENDRDIEEFVDRLGIRIVTPVHFSDDFIGGPALLRGILKLLNPLAAVKSFFHPRDHESHVLCNPRGATPMGRAFIEKLIVHGVWIDLSHASDALVEDLAPILERKNLPWLVTHSVLRRHQGSERGVTDRIVRKIGSSGGMIGLMPSDVMLGGTTSLPEHCPKGCSREACAQGVHLLARQWVETLHMTPDAAITTGTDYNGTIDRLAPSCGVEKDMDREGLVHIGQHERIWQGLRTLGVPIREKHDERIERFVSAWEKVSKTR